MNGFLFFKFLRRCSLETFQQNKTHCVLQIWVKIGLTTLHTTRARWGSWLVLKILREVSYPIEASNNFFFYRKTSIFQQLLKNKKDRFYVLNYVQTDTPDIDISRNVRKEFGFWVSLVHWRLCSYVQHLASILAPIFPKPWDTRVSMFFPALQSNTIERYKIQVEVTSVQHLFRFYMEPDGISSTSISSFWLCGTKR